jgi:hypothetical protein
VTVERLKNDASASVWPMCQTCGASVFLDYSLGSPQPFEHEVHERTQCHDGLPRVVALGRQSFVTQILFGRNLFLNR